MKFIIQCLDVTSRKSISVINNHVNQAQGYKTFTMLNSTEHEISIAYKFKCIKKFSFFSSSDKPRMLVFLLINVKMPTTAGILTIMSRINFMLN